MDNIPNNITNRILLYDESKMTAAAAAPQNMVAVTKCLIIYYIIGFLSPQLQEKTGMAWVAFVVRTLCDEVFHFMLHALLPCTRNLKRLVHS